MAVTLSALEVVDHRGVGEPGVGAAQFLGDVGMRLRHALDVRFVNDGLVVRRARGAVVVPVEERVDDHAGHRVAQRVDHRRDAAGDQVVGFEVVGVQRLGEVEVAVERLAVRVEQELGRIAAVAGHRVPGAVDPEPVPLPRGDGGQVGVPHVAVDLVELDARLGAVPGDQAEFDPVGDLGEQREVGSRPVVGRAERIGATRPHHGDGGRRSGRLGRRRRLGQRHRSTLSALGRGCSPA